MSEEETTTPVEESTEEVTEETSEETTEEESSDEQTEEEPRSRQETLEEKSKDYLDDIEEDRPFNINTDIDWSKFTFEEEQALKGYAKLGLWQYLGACIPIRYPAQEYWVQVLVDAIKPVVVKKQSKVRAELEELIAKGEDPLQTKEGQIEWQRRIDEEEGEYKKQTKRRQKERMRNLREKIKKDKK